MWVTVRSEPGNHARIVLDTSSSTYEPYIVATIISVLIASNGFILIYWPKT